MDILSA